VAGLKLGLAFDDIEVHNSHGENWCIGGYAAFQATEKLSFYGRAEYLRDRGDSKLFIKPDGLGGFMASAPDKTMELTATVQYDLWKNVLSRLELRWDHSLSGQQVWGNTKATINPDETVSTSGSLKNEFVLIANVIYKF
jgi:hypothetical protein